MIKDASSDFDSSRLLPGLVYEFASLRAAPLGPSLATGLASLARPDGERDRSDLARFGLGPGSEPVPGYHLMSRIGQGSTGEVWRASGPGGFPVALKFVGLGERDAADELYSLSLMNNIRHANLVTIFGIWQLDGLLVVGMDLADGNVLDRCAEAIGRGESGIPFGELATIMEQAARGLDFLNQPHDHPDGLGEVGLLHRDIKPQNLLLVGGSVKVGDFGLVALLDDPEEVRDSESLAPAYIPPEWSEGRMARQSDQYALAMTYCRLRSGRLPSPMIVEGRPSPGHLDLTMLPKAERPVLARALARNPEGRWPDCLTFVRELIRVVSRDWDVREARTSEAPAGSLPAVLDGRRSGRWRLAAASLFTLLALVVASRLHRGEPASEDRRPSGPVEVESAHVPNPLIPLPDATAGRRADPPEIREADASADVVTEGLATPPTGPEVLAAIDAMSAPVRGKVRRAFAALREGIAFLGREMPIEGRLADPVPIGAQGADPSVPPGEGAAVADADQCEDDLTTGELPPEPVRPEATQRAVEPKAAGPGESPSKDRRSTQAARPGQAVGEQKGAEALEAARPRPSTIVVLLPHADAELVVRGEVGKGNPDEWYGPRRVIHSPPLGEAKDYLVGSFWTDRSGRQQARSKELKVNPGRIYEVDLRSEVPSFKEVDR